MPFTRVNVAALRTGDNKCVPISKARGDPGFLDRGFKFIKGGGVRFVNFT